ncbi:hypothetical protein AGLY_008156 [Aphis glycines]|uniref:L-dopachrome isomerase n=1 Tax=Aphis glycines TaxID=307491 RepID=A0A6G0TLW7_APHGL|nr:hypothetical protein AGLY_008156 [Aphis glycines]
MPILQIDTNLSMNSVPSDFSVQTCELMAHIFKSPLNFCVVHINTDQELYWYGLDGPCVLGTLKIVSGSGTISPEQNIGHAEKLVKHISDNLKLTNKNISISFVEQDAANVTIFNTTVSNFLQNKKLLSTNTVFKSTALERLETLIFNKLSKLMVIQMELYVVMDYKMLLKQHLYFYRYLYGVEEVSSLPSTPIFPSNCLVCICAKLHSCCLLCLSSNGFNLSLTLDFLLKVLQVYQPFLMLFFHLQITMHSEKKKLKIFINQNLFFILNFSFFNDFIKTMIIFTCMSFDLESSGFPSSKSVGSTVLLLIGPLVGCGVSNHKQDTLIYVITSKYSSSGKTVCCFFAAISWVYGLDITQKYRIKTNSSCKLKLCVIMQKKSFDKD